MSPEVSILMQLPNASPQPLALNDKKISQLQVKLEKLLLQMSSPEYSSTVPLEVKQKHQYLAILKSSSNKM